MAKTPILWNCGKDNMGGYKPFILFISACEVSDAPVLPVAPALDADFVTAAGSFVFKTAGNTPQYIACTDKTVKYSSENQGEIEGQSFKQSGEFFRAGSQIEADAFARKVNNSPGYLIIEDLDGNQFIIGQPGLLCYIKPSYDGGMARADRRGYKFTFEADSVASRIHLGTKINVDDILNPA